MALTYLAFYKPYGVLTAFTDDDDQNHDTLKSYIDVPDVYPAGRLDLDSEGLLLLTNDGDLAHRLTDPRFNHPKTYLVQVEGVPTPAILAQLASGVEFKGHKARRLQVIVAPEPNLPPRAKPVTPHGPTTWLRLVLFEGKKRQIRHMTAAVGLPTLRLVRVALGPISLGELQPGEWRYLTPAEVEGLKKLVREAAYTPAPKAVPGARPAAKPQTLPRRTEGPGKTGPAKPGPADRPRPRPKPRPKSRRGLK